MPSAYKALLISNSEFPEDPHNLFPLQGPVNDSPLLRDALTDREVGLFDLADVRLLPERSKRDIMTAVEQFFRSAERDDQVLLYYSGHGFPDINGNLYLCARDTVTDALVATGISDGEINAIINLSSARAVIVILDCCYSGAFKGALPAGLKGEGRFVITSCRRGQLASDAELVTGASPFTAHLVEGVRLGNLDANSDGYVALNDLYDYVLEQLRPTGQKPQRHFDNTVGDVILARSRQATKRTLTPPPGPPILSISTDEIDLDEIGPDELLPAEVIDVFNRGGGELDWTVTTEADWIELAPQTGCFRLTMRPRPGVNRANVLVRDTGRGGSRVLRVCVRVQTKLDAPRLAISEQEVDFGTLSRGTKSPQRTIRLRNEGGGRLNVHASATDPRIHLRQLDDTLELQVDTSVVGRLDSDVHVSSEGGDARIRVRALVEPGPILTVEPKAVDFGQLLVGQQSECLVRIGNAGKGQLEWTHGSSGEFFSVQRVAGELRLRHLGGPEGRYHGSVWIRSNGGELALDVQAEVVEPPESVTGETGKRPPRPRRWPLVAVIGLALAASIGGVVGWLTQPKQPSLHGMVADFRPLGFSTKHEEPLDSLSAMTKYYPDPDRVRYGALLQRLGFRRGYIWQSVKSAGGTTLEVRVFEFETQAQALAGREDLSACAGRAPKPFDVADVPGSKGQRCLADGGGPVQEVMFARGPRLYKLKLQWGSAPRSTESITKAAQAEAAVAR
jgi:Caspase domain